MKGLSNFIAAGLLCAAAVWAYGGPPDLSKLKPVVVDNSTRPVELFGFDKTVPPIFAGNTQDARRLGRMVGALADVIVWDGTQAAPKLIYSTQITTLRQNAISIAFEGVTMNTKYPSLGTTLEPPFTSAIEDGSKTLTPQDRAKVAERFKALQWVCEH